jgi:hypothetical protein
MHGRSGRGRKGGDDRTRANARHRPTRLAARRSRRNGRRPHLAIRPIRRGSGDNRCGVYRASARGISTGASDATNEERGVDFFTLVECPHARTDLRGGRIGGARATNAPSSRIMSTVSPLCGEPSTAAIAPEKRSHGCRSRSDLSRPGASRSAPQRQPIAYARKAPDRVGDGAGKPAKGQHSRSRVATRCVR